MKRITYCLLLVIISSCVALTPTPKTLDQIKQNLTCIEYKEGVDWPVIAAAFGAPDAAPLPQPGTKLSENTRSYNNMTVIFYTKSQEFREAGKLRFKEVVYKVELCKQK